MPSMNLSAVNRVLSLLGGLFDPTRPTEGFLPMTEGKPVFSPGTPTLPRSAPESQGVPAAHLADFLQKLRGHPQLRMHSVMILRHGQVICEEDFFGQDHRYPRYTFSACKSIVSLAVGILCDLGMLSTDDRIVDLFADRVTPVARLRLSSLTVEHLLTMRSAVTFNELEAQTDEDWIKGYLNSAVNGEIGTRFQYNSLNTYLLSAIVVRVSGMSLSAFLQTHLFDAMDIRDYFWECCPRGIEKGGWGLYMRPEDLAKIGLLLLQNGMWNHKQLISRGYLSRALSPMVKTPPYTGRYDYGYQFWVGEAPRAYLCNGMFGQNVLAFPDTDILLVTTASNDELFQQGPFYDLAAAYFGNPSKVSDVPLPIPQAAVPEKRPPRTLLSVLSDRLFRSPTPRTAAHPVGVQTPRMTTLPPSAALFAGSTFAAPEEEPTAAIGLLPAVMQTVQSNYTRGFVSVSFSRAVENGEERLFVTYREKDDTHSFSAGFDRAVQTQLYFHGVPLIAAASVSFPTDEDGRQVCKLHIDFPEMPSSRIIKLFQNRDGTVLMRQEETPGAALLTDTVIGWKQNLTQSVQPMLGGALDKIDNDYLSYRIRRTLAPEIRLRRVPTE